MLAAASAPSEAPQECGIQKETFKDSCGTSEALPRVRRLQSQQGLR